MISNACPLQRAAVAALALIAMAPAAGWAQSASEVSVVIRDNPPPRRILTVEYNPLYLLIDRYSATAVVTPFSHHALVLSPFYLSTETAPVYLNPGSDNQIQLPKQKFSGFGGELGYRYYLGERGPRGFFFGPSLLLAKFTATAQNGDQTRFLNYGFAADAGFQALVADRVVLTLGAGIQYTKNNTQIPNQQFPAKLSVNGGFRPRLLLSLGWAF